MRFVIVCRKTGYVFFSKIWVGIRVSPFERQGFPPACEIPSVPHNALLEILSRNHARVVPDGFLRDLPVSMPYISSKLKKMGELQIYLILTAVFRLNIIKLIRLANNAEARSDNE